MIIPCIRCGKGIDTPNEKNADYVVASDTIGQEPREVMKALYHNDETLAKQGTGEVVLDGEYDAVEISSYEDKGNAVKVVVATEEKNIQKTGIICPDCHKSD